MRDKIYDVEFFVVWNPERRAFHIERDGIPTGTLAPDKKTAIHLATQAAKFENGEGKAAVVYATNADGKSIVEWSA